MHQGLLISATTTTLLLLCVACGDTQHADYATYSEAERAGAVQRGWIPAFVPSSATEIAEAHDLDLNTQRIRFRAPAEALQALSTQLVPLSDEEANAPGVRSPELAGEWPSKLTGSGPSLRLYRASAPGMSAGCVAIDSVRRAVYAWSCVAPA